MDDFESDEEDSGKGGRLKIFAICIGIAFLALAAVYGYKMYSKNKTIVVNPVEGSKLLSKVKGTLALSKTGLLYISNQSGTFVLEGIKAKELKGLVGKHVAVFGAMKVSDPASLDGMPVRYNVEVTEFNEGSDLQVGQN